MVSVVKRADAEARHGHRAMANKVFARMAFQNLLRRPTRTSMLVLAVALGTAAIFASFLVGKGIEASTEQSFARMGADLIVVPAKAMVNITSALLTVQPTEDGLDLKQVDEIARTSGVAQVAPQTIYRVPVMAGMPGCKTNLIAFDPARDFTVMNWLSERAPGAMKPGELIAGSRRMESVGQEIQPCLKPANIYGKLGRSGVGPFDESLFAPYETVESIVKEATGDNAPSPKFDKSRVSAVLIRLSFGAIPEQVRFALSKVPGIKVITGPSLVTSTRQTITALLGGLLGFAAMMILGSMILVSLLFSAIIEERRREIGVLQAIGAHRGNIVWMMLTEAGLTTGIGGVLGLILGGALMLGFQHSLVYLLRSLHVDFIWPSLAEMSLVAVGCLGVAFLMGALGAVLPAWRATAREPYVLINGEGK